MAPFCVLQLVHDALSGHGLVVGGQGRTLYTDTTRCDGETPKQSRNKQRFSSLNGKRVQPDEPSDWEVEQLGSVKGRGPTNQDGLAMENRLKQRSGQSE